MNKILSESEVNNLSKVLLQFHEEFNNKTTEGKFDYLLNVKPISESERVEFPSILEIIKELNKINFTSSYRINNQNSNIREYTNTLFDNAYKSISRALMPSKPSIENYNHSEGEKTNYFNNDIKGQKTNFYFKLLEDDLKKEFINALLIEMNSSKELISKFEKEISVLDNVSIQKYKEDQIQKYQVNDISNLSLNKEYNDYDVIGRVMLIGTKEAFDYDWQYVYKYGYIQNYFNRSREVPFSERLIDQYFLNLGFEHSKYYKYLLNYNGQIHLERNISVPDKILMIDCLGVIDYLKTKLKVEESDNKKIVGILNFLFEDEKKTISLVLANKDDQENTKNTFKKVINYNKVISIFEELKIEFYARKLKRQRDKSVK